MWFRINFIIVLFSQQNSPVYILLELLPRPSDHTDTVTQQVRIAHRLSFRIGSIRVL